MIKLTLSKDHNFMLMQIREIFHKTINDLKSSMNQFDQLINHPEKYIDDCISTVKNEIDIHREEIIYEIQKISAKLIAELDNYEQDCLKNLPKLKMLTQKNKNNLVELRKNLNKIIESDNDFDEMYDYIIDLHENISINKEEMQNYENELQMNSNLSFQPVQFSEKFGKFQKSPTSVKFPSSQNSFKIVKSFNLMNKNISSDYDIFNEYKLVIHKDPCIYNIQTAEFINGSKPFNDEILCPKWINKSLIAVGSDQEIKILDVDRDGECLRTFGGHSEIVTSLCFFKNKNHLISGSLNGEIKIWDLNQDKCINTLNEHKCKIDKILINSKDFLVSLSIKGKEIKVWNTNENYDNIKTIKYSDETNLKSVNLHPNGNIICISQYFFQLLDFVSGEILFNFKIYYHDFGNYDYIELSSINFLNDSLFVGSCNYTDENDERPGAYLFLFDINSESDPINNETNLNKLNYEKKEIKQISLLNNNCILVLFNNLLLGGDNSNHFEVLKLE